PFMGEGDIAAALYSGKHIYGADIDPTMVEKAKARLPDAEIITANCDQYPFKKGVATFSLADFDSYSYPYNSFRKFFEGAKIGSQCVLIFTDGQRQAIIRSGNYRTPDGEKHSLKKITEKREAYNFYFTKTVIPWFKAYITPWKILYITKYLRNGSMCYWGAIIAKPGSHNNHATHKGDEGAKGESRLVKFDSIKKEGYLENISNGHTRGYAATLVGIHRSTVINHMKKDKAFAEAVSEAERDAIGKIENALFEAATSGNVTAIQVFLYNRDPKRWADRRNIQLAGEGGGPIKVEVDGRARLISALNRLATRVRETGDSKRDERPGSG
ncbi:MAG: class I SAM-dependent methyltransferase, partial [Dehalococcoidia bacterium]|nr:class I SAM-dependent methyltransferase [Dehalococcoidia bacterium]